MRSGSALDRSPFAGGSQAGRPTPALPSPFEEPLLTRIMLAVGSGGLKARQDFRLKAVL